MGDLESLLLVLAAIYLSECAVWVRRGAVALHSYRGRTWHLWHPGTLLGNARGALFLANPLPPLGTVLLAHQFPVSLSPQGMFSFTAACINPGWRPSQPANHLRYADARTITVEGRRLLVNGTLFVKAPSPATARSLAGLLLRLSSLPETARVAPIRAALREAFDAEKARTRWEQFQAQAKILRFLTNLLFVFLFVLAPLLLWKFGLRFVGAAVGAMLLGQTFTIGWLFYRAHRALFSDGAEDRLAPFLTMLLAPPAAIRAHDLLARQLLATFHPLAAAQILCPASEFKSIARHALLDLRFPILPASPTPESEPRQTEEWFRRVVLEEMDRAIERAGLKPAELLQPPTPLEKQNRSYCPRCGAQFVTAQGTCDDCGGRPLFCWEGEAPAEP